MVSKAGVLDKARIVLSTGCVCDNCLGRQFAQLLTGFSNKERGETLRRALAFEQELKENKKIDKSNFHDFKFRHAKIKDSKKKTCHVCEGIFEKIGVIVDKCVFELKGLEFDTFHVGATPTKELLENEETLWEDAGIDFVESLKTEISREVGKKLQKILKKEVDLKQPDVVILVNLEKNAIELTINPIYIYGKYKKLKPMPQTKWHCYECRGLGCKVCNYTGRKYDTSVQEKIGDLILKKTEGVDTKFHGAGREDVDVLCKTLREFVLEVLQPRKRVIDLKKMESAINKKYKGEVEVKYLKIVEKPKVQEVKESRKEKTYKVIVSLEDEIKKDDLKTIDGLLGTINQQTPERVAHRRADIIRKRKVLSITSKFIDKRKIELEITTEAGMYIKELISGDNGRTRPSVSSVMNTKAKVEKLVVVDIA